MYLRHRNRKTTNDLLSESSELSLTNVDDSHARGGVELTAGGTESSGVTSVVGDSALAEHSVVLDLRSTERRAVIGDDDSLSSAGTKASKDLLVTKNVLTGLDDERKMGVDTFDRTLRGHYYYT